MYLKLDGANVAAGMRDGVAIFTFTGRVERSTLDAASTLFLLQHQGPMPIAALMRFDSAELVDGASWCLTPAADSRVDIPVAAVVSPEAVEWALAFSYERAMRGRLLGVFTTVETAHRWVLARAAVQPVAASVAAPQKTTSAR